jgi:glycosyltransferase involved in cell wall biosynthesis
LALWGSGIPLVVVGDAHLEHADYYQRCRRESDAGVTFVGRLDHESPLLAAAYAAARVVVLASWFETPGLAALEGGLAGAEVVVTRRGSAREYFGDMARYVEPDDVMGIRAAVRDAMISRTAGQLRDHIRNRFLWANVAEQTLAAYQRHGGTRRVSVPAKLAAAA